jgi:cobalt-precorrin 5A hydrolase
LQIAVWALTPNGAELARKIADGWPQARLYLSARLKIPSGAFNTFHRLADALSEEFLRYQGHIFIMSTGIVIRMIAPLIRHKTVDPAVIVIDEAGRYAISLLSGHIGGANALTEQVACHIQAIPVITTATDIQGVPAIDVLAKEKKLVIENPDAIKTVNMAFLTRKKVCLHDPYGLLDKTIPDSMWMKCAARIRGRHGHWTEPMAMDFSIVEGSCTLRDQPVAIYIDDRLTDIPPQTLILRPKSLTVGMGCNRNTSASEMKALLLKVLSRHALSPLSLSGIATISIKRDEPGLLALAEGLGIPLTFYEKVALEQVPGVPTPSATVEKHIGVKSVCEAAAILASRNGKLIVPKQSTRNVTVAIARTSFMS